jgi:hypothetical protein
VKRYLNVKNIIIFIVVLALLHFGTGLILSPKLGALIVNKINENSSAKITAEKVAVWPLTLSFSLKNLKVFDPEKTDQRIIAVKDLSVYVSPLGLLSKRLVVSAVNVNGAQINLQGEPDGTFNVQKLAQLKNPQGKPEEKAGLGLIQLPGQKKDPFGMVYDLLKKKFSRESLDKQKAKQAQAKKVTKTALNLPKAKGRIVHFKSAGDYLFEIKKVSVKNTDLNITSQDGQSVQIEKARITLSNIGADPELGFRLGRFYMAGDVKKANVPAGSLKLSYINSLHKGANQTRADLKLKDVNLDAIRFIYEDSLPIEVVKGTLDLDSVTTIVNGDINSANKLSLHDHELKPKGLGGLSAGFMPAPVLCESLNKINPVNLNFKISGTVETPQFNGLMKSVTDLVKPNLKSIGQETIKNNALQAIGGFLKK